MNTLPPGCCILLTGAGGSIGSALAHALVQMQPRALVLLDHSEDHLHQIDRELSQLAFARACRAIVGDMGDGALLEELFQEHQPEIVLHTAAYKQVPLMESNALAAIRNNALATNILARAARVHGVSSFVMVSTDKAVNPHSIMGATKRLAELALLRWNSRGGVMRAVRLGNVRGSRGSVVPLFAQQIADGGPVTVTHPEANRYFLSMEETVELILLAAQLNDEGGIYIPSPGEPLRIVELAQQLIQEAGHSASKEIPVVITGLRPGDKLSEQFLSANETVEDGDGSALRRINSPSLSEETFDRVFGALQESVEQRDLQGAIRVISSVVPEYRPSELLLASCGEPRSTSL